MTLQLEIAVKSTMNYGSGTVVKIASRQPADAAEYAAVGAGRMLHVHSPSGSSFLSEMK